MSRTLAGNRIPHQEIGNGYAKSLRESIQVVQAGCILLVRCPEVGAMKTACAAASCDERGTQDDVVR